MKTTITNTDTNEVVAKAESYADAVAFVKSQPSFVRARLMIVVEVL